MVLYGFTLIYRGCNLAAHLSHHHRKHHTHCSQSFVSPDWIPPSTYSWQPKKLPACPPFLSSSLFTWINPLKASFLLCWKNVPFRWESCWQPPLCPPTSVRWNQFREHQSGHQSSYWLCTSVLNESANESWCHTFPTKNIT